MTSTFADGIREPRLPDAVGSLFRTANRQDLCYGPAVQRLEANGTRYEYDEMDNLCTKILRTGEEWHYAWNSVGHLAEVVRPDGGVVRFTYDALGQRVSKSYKGRVTHWVWDENKPLHEWTELEVGAGTQAAAEVLTWLFEEESFAPVAKLQGREQHSILTDHLGTPVQMHDGQGQQVWAAELDSYGKVRQHEGEAACPFRYQGQYEDVETGLYYNRFRYYDPECGQYIYQDPIGLNGGSRLYSYVQDPLLWIDTFGLNQIFANQGDLGEYGVLKDILGGGQAHHLNQDAAFRDVIPSAKGMAIKLRGNAFTQVNSNHYKVHQSLEGFWDQYRRGGANFGKLPTNLEYTKWSCLSSIV